MSVSCEKMVKHVVPWIRKELAVSLVKNYKLSQVKVAEVLEVTEPAISQYLSSKRGNDIHMEDETVILAINDSAARLANGRKNNVSSEICILCKLIRKRHAIPDIIINKAKIGDYEKCICDIN